MCNWLRKATPRVFRWARAAVQGKLEPVEPRHASSPAEVESLAMASEPGFSADFQHEALAAAAKDPQNLDAVEAQADCRHAAPTAVGDEPQEATADASHERAADGEVGSTSQGHSKAAAYRIGVDLVSHMAGELRKHEKGPEDAVTAPPWVPRNPSQRLRQHSPRVALPSPRRALPSPRQARGVRPERSASNGHSRLLRAGLVSEQELEQLAQGPGSEMRKASPGACCAPEDDGKQRRAPKETPSRHACAWMRAALPGHGVSDAQGD